MVQFYCAPKAKTKVKSMQSPKITLEIVRLDGFGQGIGFWNHKPVFVENALPTETVEIQITEDKKTHAKGKVLRRLSRSADRIAPRCHYYGLCGGCQLQQLDLAKQHRIKETYFESQFKGVLNLDQMNLSWIADQPFAYRRRVRLALYPDSKTQTLQFGFRKAQQKTIVSIKECPILTERLNLILEPIYLVLADFKNLKKLGHLDLFDVESGLTAVLRVMSPLSENEKAALQKAAKTHDINFYVQEKTLTLIAGKPDLFYQIQGLTLFFSPFDFIQVNRAINQKMIARLLDLIGENPVKILDLFCGMGNLSLPMAKTAAKVVGVEVVENLIQKARENAHFNANKLSADIEFHQADLSKSTGKEAFWQPDYDFVVLDPAREGAANVVDILIKKRHQKIIYISCNSATLSRDCQKLIQAGYQLKKIALIDMFPQTKHNESMLLLTLN